MSVPSTEQRVRGVIAETLGVPIENITNTTLLSDGVDRIAQQLALDFEIPEYEPPAPDCWTSVASVLESIVKHLEHERQLNMGDLMAAKAEERAA